MRPSSAQRRLSGGSNSRPSSAGSSASRRAKPVQSAPRASPLEGRGLPSAWDGSCGGEQLPNHQSASLKIPRALKGGAFAYCVHTPIGSLNEDEMHPSNPSALAAERHRLKQFRSDEPSEFGWDAAIDAANEGRIEDLKWLIGKSSDLIRRPCNVGNTTLHIAARSGQTEVIKFILSQNAAVNGRNKNGWTPLAWASMNGHSEVVKILLEAGSDFTLPDEEGITPMMWAAKHGHKAVVPLLLSAGSDVGTTDHKGLTASDHAHNHAELRSVLVSLKRVNDALLDGARRNDPMSVRRALNEGAQIDHLSEEGWNALSYAAVYGSLDMVRLLVRHGASVELHKSSSEQLQRCCPNFVEVRRILDEASSANRSIMKAASAANWKHVRTALEMHARVDVREEGSRMDLLGWAARHGSADMLLELVNRGANVDSIDVNGWSAFHHAVTSQSTEVVCWLYHFKCSLEHKTFAGDSLIKLAAASDDASMVQLLLAAKCHVEDGDLDGHTPAQVASFKGCSLALQALITCQANIKVTDALDKSCLHVAVEQGHAKATQVLLSMPQLLSKVTCEGLLDQYLVSSKTKGPLLHKIKRKPTQIDDEESLSGDSVDTTTSRSSKQSQASRETSQKSTTSKSSVTTNAGKGPKPGTPSGMKRQGSRGKLSTDSKTSPEKKELKKLLSSKMSVTTIPEVDVNLTPEEESAAGPFSLIAMTRKMRDLVWCNLPDRVGQTLLNAGDGSGKTPLALSVCAGQTHLLTLLVQQKAQLDTADRDGNTPLIHAALRGHLEMVQILVEVGAQVPIKNKAGQRASDVAQTEAVRLALVPPLVRRLAGIPRPPSAAAALKVIRRMDSDTNFVERHRIRIEGLPAELPAHLLEGHVRALLRRLGVAEPKKVEVPFEPITQRVFGYALIDFDDFQKADFFLKSDSRKLDRLCGTNVCVLKELDLRRPRPVSAASERFRGRAEQQPD